ncbi:hypothetical protein B0I35DRAFT_516291 [Stachybotrys elegans]|uniref:Protein kinase domain-containing protein n=1 Tax=Stachybotrys elegans TaxID=80388 RepID=A0A8K0SG53_9HYPO|nr:hypothetical protein B0I35DRAFT_516291 [Stachybotrys elegans]
MNDEITNINPSDVNFLEELKEGKSASIFKVILRGRDSVMKVYHRRNRRPWENPEREHDVFNREVTSYRRLKQHGLCARRVVPDFYGAVTQMQLADWHQMLHSFKEDEVPPCAIFIEYIPDLHMIDLTNFSEARLAKFLQILDEIHNLRILHDDTYPRNMLVARGNEGQEDRVIWIDFDCAWTNLPDDERHRQWFEDEKELVQYFAKALVGFEHHFLNISNAL